MIWYIILIIPLFVFFYSFLQHAFFSHLLLSFLSYLLLLVLALAACFFWLASYSCSVPFFFPIFPCFVLHLAFLSRLLASSFCFSHCCLKCLLWRRSPLLSAGSADIRICFIYTHITVWYSMYNAIFGLFLDLGGLFRSWRMRAFPQMHCNVLEWHCESFGSWALRSMSWEKQALMPRVLGSSDSPWKTSEMLASRSRTMLAELGVFSFLLPRFGHVRVLTEVVPTMYQPCKLHQTRFFCPFHPYKSSAQAAYDHVAARFHTHLSPSKFTGAACCWAQRGWAPPSRCGSGRAAAVWPRDAEEYWRQCQRAEDTRKIGLVHGAGKERERERDVASKAMKAVLLRQLQRI